MPNGKNHSIKINTIVCGGTSEFGNYNDEVYIIYQADAGIPIRYPADHAQAMNIPGETSDGAVSTWTVGLELDFDYEVLVTLWDEDVRYLPDLSEFLINADYRPGNVPASYTMSNNNGAKYTINATSIA